MGMYERKLLGYDSKLLSIGGKLLRLFATGLYTFDEVNTMILLNGYIPVASAAEFVALRTTTSQTMGAGTVWEGVYTTGLNKNYVQVQNIDMAQLGYEYAPQAGNFSGIYDGNELTIINFNVTMTSDYRMGLFDAITGTAKNIRVTANLSIYLSSGIIAQFNNGLIDNCVTFGSIEKNTAGGTSAAIGGIAGTGTSGTFTNCINYATVTSTFSAYCGGISGNGGTISGCTNYGDVTGTSQVGGIAGRAPLLVEYCKNYGAIEGTSTTNHNATGSCAGGIVGWHLLKTSIVRKCSNHGSVTGVYFVGGIAGTFSLAGYTIDCYNEASVSGTGSVGGCFGGQYNGDTINCYNVGAVTASLTSKGGLIGTLGPTYPVITNSYYDSQTSGMSDTGKGLPRTTAQMKYGTASSFINSDGTTDATEDPANAMYTAWSTDVWDFLTTADYPELKPEV